MIVDDCRNLRMVRSQARQCSVSRAERRCHRSCAGAIDDIIAQGYSANKMIAGAPILSRNIVSGLYAFHVDGNRIGFPERSRSNYLETEIDGAWWTMLTT